MFLVYGALYWFALLATAIANAVLREKLLKPWLEPSLGKWAHQLSVFTGYGLFLLMTVLFLKLQRAPYSARDLWTLGAIWCGLTVVFEFGFGRYIAGRQWEHLLFEYNLAAGRIWILVPIWVFFAPPLIRRLRMC